MWRECLTAQALQNLLSGGFPALIDDGSAHFRASQPIRQDSWQSTWRDTGRKVEELRGGRWRDPGVQGGGTPGRKVEGPRGGRWRNSGVQGGGTQGCKVEEPRGGRWRNPGEEGEGQREHHETARETHRGGRWRNPGVQGGGQREHHETARETQWGDLCKAVRELACCSALRRWVTKNTRRESEAHAWEDAAVRHRRVAEVFGEVHASTRKRNVTLAAAGPDRWSW